MHRQVNKFGVPYHAYTLRLDNGFVIKFEMACAEDWGSVSEWNARWNYGQLNDDGEPYGYQNGGAEELYVGYGNEVDGFRKIILVYDEDVCRYINPFEFLCSAQKYISYYSD